MMKKQFAKLPELEQEKIESEYHRMEPEEFDEQMAQAKAKEAVMTDFNSQSNRELDVLVAEKVMGLIPCDQWTEMNFGSAGGPALLKNCDHENCYSTLEIGSIHGTIGGCPHYSSKIHSAWEVVRRMQSSGYDLTLESGGGGEEWFASFRPSVPAAGGDAANEGAARSSSGSAETAICLAAMKVMFVE
jgi:hypothetical protein